MRNTVSKIKSAIDGINSSLDIQRKKVINLKT